MKNLNKIINERLKTPESFFEWCYSCIPTYKWSNKEKTITGSNRANCEVIRKRLTKRSRLDLPDKFYSFAIILVSKKRIEIQSYGFWVQYVSGKEIISKKLINFEQFANDEHIKIGNSYGEYYESLVPIHRGMSGPYHGTVFYENGWVERAKTISELKYIEVDLINRYDLANFYRYRNEIEFAQKINAKRLAEDIMYPYMNYNGRGKSVDMRTINIKYLKANKQFFKNSDRSFEEIELERRINKRKGKVMPGIEKYLNYRDINYIPKGIGIIKFQNWVIKNSVNFNYYKDYLSIMNDIGVAVDSENLIIPKNLEIAHDNAVLLLNQIELEKKEKALEERNTEYEKTLEQRIKYEAELNGYSFILPKKLSEIVVEGKKLNHCVGGSNYIEKHRKGQTTIIFVRDSRNINEPLYTLEFKGNQIAQLRGKMNAAPPDEIKEIADQWLQQIAS